MVYRDYDQAGLDAQYNLRHRVPDYPAYVARWAAATARAQARHHVIADLAYGPTAAERLDLYLAGEPDPSTPRPLQLFVHGGYWQAMDKAHFGYLADGFVADGVHLAVCDYALAPAVPMDEIVRQVRAALAWLWRQAPAFGADRARLSVSGHSAGGHLAAMLLLTDWPAFDAGLPPRPLAGALAISGLFDLEPIRLCYLNQVLRLDAGAARANSPLRLLQARPAGAPAPGRLVLSLGGEETDEFHRQQAAFADAWRAAKLPLETVAMPGEHHFSVIDRLAEPASPLARAARRLAGA